MKSVEKLDGWEQHRRDQLRSWMRATPAQRLAALEEMVEFARKYAGIARRHSRPGKGETAAS
jgi:hypothetical protein